MGPRVVADPGRSATERRGLSNCRVTALFADEPMMTTLFAYWNERRRGRAAPDRADIDPVEIDRRILPYVTLYDVFDGGRRARARVIGSALIPDLGIPDPTGHFVDEYLTPAQAAYFTSIMIDIVAKQCPIYSIDRHSTLQRQHLLVKRLILPLTRGGAAVAQTIGLTRHVPCCEDAIPWGTISDSGSTENSRERKEIARYRIRDDAVELAERD